MPHPVVLPALRRVTPLAALAAAVAVAACSDAPTGSSSTALSSQAKAYLDSALDFEDTVFYWHSKVNWPAQQQDVVTFAGAARTYSDTYDAIYRSIDPWLRNAGDQHSDFWEPSDAPGTVDPPPDSVVYQVSGLMLPSSAGVTTGHPVAYVWFPTYDGTNDNGRADTTQTVIRTLDQNAPCGWVLDLRYNPGGQPTAMMAGLEPLIGEAPASRTQAGFAGWVDYTNTRYALYVANGVAGEYDPSSNTYYPEVRTSNPYTLKKPASPVAVLVGPYTASAGEWLTLGFRGGSVPYRTFGAATYGVTTVPYNTTLQDGGFLNITAGIMMDRTGQLYGGAITPDVAVSGPSPNALSPTAPATAPDAVVKAAVAWLNSQPACGGTTVAGVSASRAPASVAALPGEVKPGLGAQRVSRHWAPRLMRTLTAMHPMRQR